MARKIGDIYKYPKRELNQMIMTTEEKYPFINFRKEWLIIVHVKYMKLKNRKNFRFGVRK